VGSGGGVELDRTVESIRVAGRFRRDLGDLDELCASIEVVGLLQPITITPDGTLVCGARRLAAVKRLGWPLVKVWVTSTISSRLAEVLAEQHENTVRKPFTPTEAAALYAELKQLYAADAARRQQATRFTGQRNPRRERAVDGDAVDGDADSAPPRAPAGTGTVAAGAARRQAARAITGKDSSWSLEHVAEVRRLAENPASPERLRQIARLELAGMDADGTVNGHYLIVQAARAAIVRASTPAPTGEASRSTDAANESGPSAGAGLRLVAAKRYGLRAFLATVEELDGWWQHYDPGEIAAALTEEQWQRLCANRDGSSAFIQAVAAARAADGRQACATDRPSRAACS
jgi:ParB family chromosome partitioning protein